VSQRRVITVGTHHSLIRINFRNIRVYSKINHYQYLWLAEWIIRSHCNNASRLQWERIIHSANHRYRKWLILEYNRIFLKSILIKNYKWWHEWYIYSSNNAPRSKIKNVIKYYLAAKRIRCSLSFRISSSIIEELSCSSISSTIAVLTAVLGISVTLGKIFVLSVLTSRFDSTGWFTESSVDGLMIKLELPPLLLATTAFLDTMTLVNLGMYTSSPMNSFFNLIFSKIYTLNLPRYR
jgi:hypothetical protein